MMPISRPPSRRLAWAAAGAALLVWTATLHPPVRAQDVVAPPGGAALYENGWRALHEGLPRVAVYKLRAFLQTAPAPGPRREAVLTLLRALLAIPDAPAALTLLDGEFPPDAAGGGDPTILFWRGQAQAALGRWPDALANYTAAASSDAAPADTRASARFGQGEALLALKRSQEAAAAFRTLRDHPQLGEAARLRSAEIALETRHLKEAASVLLDPHPGPSGDAGGSRLLLAKERAYLLGRLRLAQRQPAVAAGVFTRALAKPEGLSERLLVDNYWGWAQACLDQDNLDTAQDALENLLERYPRNTFLAQTFTWLESLYLRDPAPDLSVPRRWSADNTEPARQALARLTVGHLEAHAGHHERAEEIFEGFGEAFPEHPLRVRALLDLAALRLRLGRPADARRALDLARPLVFALPADGPPPASGAAGDGVPGGDGGRTAPLPTVPLPASSWRTETDVLDAGISLAQNDGIGAARRFEAVAARLGKGPQAEAAAFNAVLGWLRAMDVDRFTEAEAEFTARFPKSKLNAEFDLEEGLARADQSPANDRSARQRAAACLRRFLREHPTHPRTAEARIALAELAFERPRQNLTGAWRELSAPELQPVANDAPGSPPPDNINNTAADAPTPAGSPAPPVAVATDAERDRAAYLAIWLADAPGADRKEDRAVTLARKFLAERPASALAPEVRMKLGEIYFQREDYPNAQTQLELLAENAPDSALAEPALYLAGMSAMLSASTTGLDKAVTLFEAAARRGGPFKLRARLQQAEVQIRLDKGRDALILYDGVLTATANTANLRDEDLESRCAALCGRGKTCLALATGGGTDAAKLYRDAVSAFDQLAQTPGGSLLWRRQALTLKGHALEKLGDTDAALAAYDDALNAPEPLPTLASGGNGSAPSPAPPPEWTWFYRAGHDAALLLEGRAQWAAAIAIYKKLAAADGPMKSEFENTLSRRRLEHFIWEE